jgi:hypothetical protein
MGEAVNVVVAFAVIILIVRWATTSSASRSSVASPYHSVLHEVASLRQSKQLPVHCASGRKK